MMRRVINILILILVVKSHPMAQVDLNSGLVAHYDFNGGPEDISGNGHHGTVQDATLTEDRFGNCDYAYLFAPSLNLVSIPNVVMDGLTTFSVSLWFRTDRPGVAFTAANPDRNNEFYIEVVSSGRIFTSVRSDPRQRNQSIGGNGIVHDDQWHHIVIIRTHTDGNMAIYIDGQLDIETNIMTSGQPFPTGPLEVSVNGLHMGNDQDCVAGCWDPNQQWNGELDDVRIFNRELTLDEIDALHNIDETVNYPALDLGPDVEACAVPVTLDAGAGFDSYLWSTGETTQTIEATTTGTYSVTTNFLECSFNDEIEVNLAERQQLSITPERITISCNDQITLEATAGFSNYTWSDGQTGRVIIIDSPGVYSVNADDQCGQVSSEEVNIIFESTDEVSVIFSRATLGCDDQISLEATAGFDSYMWSDGQTGRQINVSNPGTYFVTATNSCGNVVSQEVEISSIFEGALDLSNAFSPNGDGVNDYFELPVALVGSQLKVFSRWGTKIYESADYQNTWAAENYPNGVYYFTVYNPCLPDVLRGWVRIIK